MKFILITLFTFTLISCASTDAVKRDQLILDVPAELLKPPQKLNLL